DLIVFSLISAALSRLRIVIIISPIKGFRKPEGNLHIFLLILFFLFLAVSVRPGKTELRVNESPPRLNRRRRPGRQPYVSGCEGGRKYSGCRRQHKSCPYFPVFHSHNFLPPAS